MPSISKKIVRISEWAKIDTHALSIEQCHQLEAATLAWASQQRLPVPPLSFSGSGSQSLCASQYVGVVETDDVAVEIYPKLDAALVSNGDSTPISESVKLDSVMRNLLWMLEVSEHREIVETDTGQLEEAPTSFFDLFAFLLGKNLLNQLMCGVSHKYVAHSDDLHTVRGKIRFAQQVSRNWNRLDRIACTWDEFTPNTPVNRLFKCACRFLANRVSYSEAARLLIDCLALLEEVEDVSPLTVLREVQNMPFDRSMDRFRLAFDLAKRLLMASGHALGVGGANTYVFLINMNKLFESYVHAVLEAHFHADVAEQKPVGYLFPQLSKGRIQQNADYFWPQAAGIWIGDAKYKHLAKRQGSALKFAELPDAEDREDNDTTLAGHVLSAADVRQLTVYSELASRKEFTGKPLKVSLMLLYPFIGTECECVSDRAQAWNGDDFWLVPVRVRQQNDLASLIPPIV
jgi:5-methylcytosine-specific restriction enzyme subunit McrC